jgi:hypothetical protein
LVAGLSYAIILSWGKRQCRQGLVEVPNAHGCLKIAPPAPGNVVR